MKSTHSDSLCGRLRTVKGRQPAEAKAERKAGPEASVSGI
jgi:hypothetical protein